MRKLISVITSIVLAIGLCPSFAYAADSLQATTSSLSAMSEDGADLEGDNEGADQGLDVPEGDDEGDEEGFDEAESAEANPWIEKIEFTPLAGVYELEQYKNGHLLFEQLTFDDEGNLDETPFFYYIPYYAQGDCLTVYRYAQPENSEAEGPEEGQQATPYRYTYDEGEDQFISEDGLDPIKAYDLSRYTNQEDDPWGLGKIDEAVSFEYEGHEASASVSITPSKVKAIDFEPVFEEGKQWIEVYEGRDGDLREEGGDGQYFDYDPDPFVEGSKLTVTSIDESGKDVAKTYAYADYITDENIETSYSYFNIDAEQVVGVRASLVTNQTESHWTLDAEDAAPTKQVIVWYAGQYCTVPVKVVKNPVSSIELLLPAGMDPIEITSGTKPGNVNGHGENGALWREYELDYRLPLHTQLTVNYADPEKASTAYRYEQVKTQLGDEEGEDDYELANMFVNVDDPSDSFEYGWYFTSDQDENEWLARDEPYTATFHCFGKTADVKWKVLPSGIKGIAVELASGKDAIEAVESDEGRDLSYFKLGDKLIVLYDDPSKESTVYVYASDDMDSHFVYENGYQADFDEEQFDYTLEGPYDDGEDGWQLADEGYFVTVSYYGVTCEVPVKVVRNEVSSIAFEYDGSPIIVNPDVIQNNIQLYGFDNDIAARGKLIVSYSDGSTATFEFDEDKLEFVDTASESKRDPISMNDVRFNMFNADLGSNEVTVEYAFRSSNPFTVEIECRSAQDYAPLKIEQAFGSTIWFGDSVYFDLNEKSYMYLKGEPIEFTLSSNNAAYSVSDATYQIGSEEDETLHPVRKDPADSGFEYTITDPGDGPVFIKYRTEMTATVDDKGVMSFDGPAEKAYRLAFALDEGIEYDGVAFGDASIDTSNVVEVELESKERAVFLFANSMSLIRLKVPEGQIDQLADPVLDPQSAGTLSIDDSAYGEGDALVVRVSLTNPATIKLAYREKEPVYTDRITITAKSDSKVYDGQPLSNGEYSVSGELPNGYKVEAKVQGTITEAGEASNQIADYKILDSEGNDRTDQFVNVVRLSGKLTVEPAGASSAKVTLQETADGKALKNDSEYYYAGNSISPNFDVNLGGKVLVYGQDYTVEVTGEPVKAEGSYSATVQYQGNYKGSSEFEFSVVPSAVGYEERAAALKPFDEIVHGDADTQASLKDIADYYDKLDNAQRKLIAAKALATVAKAEDLSADEEDGQETAPSLESASGNSPETPKVTVAGSVIDELQKALSKVNETYELALVVQTNEETADSDAYEEYRQAEGDDIKVFEISLEAFDGQGEMVTDSLGETAAKLSENLNGLKITIPVGTDHVGKWVRVVHRHKNADDTIEENVYGAEVDTEGNITIKVNKLSSFILSIPAKAGTDDGGDNGNGGTGGSTGDGGDTGNDSGSNTGEGDGGTDAPGNEGAGHGNVAPAPATPAGLAAGKTAVIGGATYLANADGSTVTYKLAPKSKKSVTVSATVSINGKSYAVSGIAKNAFKKAKAKTVTIKSTKLTKKSIKGCFKGAKKLKTVKAPKAKKKAYKKIFTKKVCGVKIKVK